MWYADSAALGMADVTGELDVYSRGGKTSRACTINQGHARICRGQEGQLLADAALSQGH
eukprot:SAG11_NODE_4748_length_1781_cov_1.315101_1_plen_58_part_10